jgi:arylsulfatase A-like enzyme
MRGFINRSRRDFLKCVGLGAGAALLAPGAVRAFHSGGKAEQKDKPNIIVILADDMGFCDVGCYGSEIETPNIDALAERGVRFTNFYNSPRCCPSRSALMTGVYPHRAGVGHMLEKWREPSYTDGLRPNVMTVAEAMKTAGCRTMMSGKWHLGWREDGSPTARGFGLFHGSRGFVDSYFTVVPQTDIYLGDKIINRAGEKPVNQLHPEQEWYTTDVYTDYSLEFMKQALKEKQPFFSYLAFNSPHFPLHARTEDLQKFLGAYDAGWDRARAARYAKMRSLGIVSRQWKLADTGLPPWDSLTPEQRENSAFRMSAFAAIVSRMDWNIGRVFSMLKAEGALDNTLVIFLSDNGGTGEGELLGFNFEKNTRANYPQWQTAGGWTSSYGQGWASVSNAPFRGFKRFCHEGGISTPLIISWPERIRARGELRHQVGYIFDLLPTCMEAVGAKRPDTLNGKPVEALDGISLMPAVEGKALSDRPFFWEHEGNRAARSGKWKLVAKDHEPWELYDMQADRTETNNLVGRHPEVVRELESLYQKWTERCHVYPYDEVDPRRKRG